jgi:hypothetical protein
MVILEEDLIKAAKIAAIEDGRNVSGSSRNCWRDGWRAETRDDGSRRLRTTRSAPY